MVLALRLYGVLAALWLVFFQGCGPGLHGYGRRSGVSHCGAGFRLISPGPVSCCNRPCQTALADNTLRRLLVARGRAYQAQGRGPGMTRSWNCLRVNARGLTGAFCAALKDKGMSCLPVWRFHPSDHKETAYRNLDHCSVGYSEKSETSPWHPRTYY